MKMFKRPSKIPFPSKEKFHLRNSVVSQQQEGSFPASSWNTTVISNTNGNEEDLEIYSLFLIDNCLYPTLSDASQVVLSNAIGNMTSTIPRYNMIMNSTIHNITTSPASLQVYTLEISMKTTIPVMNNQSMTLLKDSDDNTTSVYRFFHTTLNHNNTASFSHVLHYYANLQNDTMFSNAMVEDMYITNHTILFLTKSPVTGTAPTAPSTPTNALSLTSNTPNTAILYMIIIILAILVIIIYCCGGCQCCGKRNKQKIHVFVDDI